MNDLRINGPRLWTSLMELARIGATDKGGVKRLALTDLDRQGRDLVVAVGAGSRAWRSPSTQIGNVFMRREGSEPGAAARRHRQPHRHPADRRQVRRQLRRAGRAGSGAHPERARHPDRGADRGRVLDQRGRLALRAGDDGLGRVLRRLQPGDGLRGARRRRQVGRRGAGADRLPGRRRRRATTRSAPISRPTSSRARCWKTRTR